MNPFRTCHLLKTCHPSKKKKKVSEKTLCFLNARKLKKKKNKEVEITLIKMKTVTVYFSD